MFRLLPWPSAIGGNKVMAEEVKMLAPSCASSGVNALSLPPMLKRKRSSSSTADAPAATKVRTEESTRPVHCVPSMPPTPSPSVAPSVDVAATPAAPSPTVATTVEPPQALAASGKPSVNHIRDTITAQLSLEVLLKHNELRLIDQEIAKCQIALEQLRRCSEIPYPGSSVTGVSADVSSGVGASVLQPGNGPAPLSPAPWGVTEGPYSRHYKQWLIPDPRFDGGQVEASSAAGVSGTPVEGGRSTRGNPIDFTQLAGKSRPSRTSTSAKMQSLPHIFPPAKEKTGPMVIRRKSDNLMVKLVCLDCKRENFSSTQGFINHCRIAHNRNFTSHEAAAIACGAAVDVDDSGVIVGGRSEPPSAVATPGTVHPLIQSTQLPPPSTLPTPSKEVATPRKPSEVNSTVPIATPPATAKQAPAPRRSAQTVKPKENPSFLASPATPHLSALMRQRGFGLNLGKLVDEAKTPVDLSGLSDDESDSEDSSHPSKESSQAPAAARQPMRMPTAQTASERTESRKGIDRAPHEPQTQHEMTPSRPQPPSYLNFPFHVPGETVDADGLDHPANLSPHTIESNQAPSLVSDDEDDYEAASDSDSPSSSEADDQEQEFRHIEVADDERNTAQSTTTSESKPGPSLNPTPQTAPIAHPLKRSRSKMSMMPFDRDEEDQRRSFVHPSQDPSKTKRADQKPAPPR